MAAAGEEAGRQEQPVKRRVVCDVADGPVFGLRPGAGGKKDEILVDDDGRLVWVSEESRPDLAQATWSFQRKVIRKEGKTRRGIDACRCLGCLSPICGRCTAHICGGGSGRVKCKNRWCEYPRTVGGKVEEGRGKLRRERKGSVPTPEEEELESSPMSLMCIGLCKAALGSDEKWGACPDLRVGTLPIRGICPCGRDIVTTLTEHRAHRRNCYLRKEEAEEAWASTLMAAARQTVAGSAQRQECRQPGCDDKAAGIRGMYSHLVTAHWELLPPNRRLEVAAYAAIMREWRMRGLTVDHRSLQWIHESYPEAVQWV